MKNSTPNKDLLKNRRSFKISATLLFLTLVMIPISSLQQTGNFKIWIDYSLENLTKMGRRYMKQNNTDSALVCYSIVAGRYNKDLSLSEQKLCRDAYFNRWLIYFNKMYDFSKAYENLTKAEEISKNIGETDPEIEMGFAYFYETLEDNIQDNTNRIKNMQHCSKAFYSSLENNHTGILDRAFVNYITSAYKYGEFSDESKQIFTDYKNHEVESQSFFKKFNVALYGLYDHILNDRYAEALQLADKIKEYIISGEYPDQFLYIAQCVKFDIYKKKGDYSKALECMNVVHEILLRNPNINKRSTLEMYKDMYFCNQKLGDTEAYKDNLNRYLLLKDTLLNMKQITRMNEISFLNEITKMDEDLAMMRARAHTQSMFFILMVLIVLIVLSSAFILYKKNKHLSEANRILYDNYNELIKTKDKEIEHILSETNKKEKGLKTESEPEDETTTKYKDSSLKSDEKDKILARILQVMEDVNEICSNEFSAERLAGLTSTSYKNVSQVINEKFECNFNVFLNRYRIKEACRRLSDMEEYGMYTIEAISESVGFKSRTRFASNFKRIVGISPSEYRKIAIERNSGV